MREYRFTKLAEIDAEFGVKNLADDPAVALLAMCIASQQSAGLDDVLDLRAAPCQSCGSPGYNTGWGYWKHTCGAAVLSCGEVSKDCPGGARVRGRSRAAGAVG